MRKKGKVTGVLLSAVLIVLMGAMGTQPVNAGYEDSSTFIMPGTSQNGQFEFLWQFMFEEADFWIDDVDPAIGDIRGDANLEIITGSGEYNWPDGGRYVALDSEGTLLWEAFTGDDWAQAPPTLADINLDGSTEIIGGSCSGRWVFLIDGEGNEIWRFGEYGEFNGAAVVADVAPDPGLEMLMADEAGRIFLINSSGGSVWQHDDRYLYDDFIASPAGGDLDGDGELEAVLVDSWGLVIVLDLATGTVEWTKEIGDTVVSSPALADLDGDGLPEIVFGTGGADYYNSYGEELYCLDGRTGDTEWVFKAGGIVQSSPAIGDVDADGSPDIVFGSGDGNVYCLNSDGSVKWTYQTEGPVHGSPSLVDRTNTGVHAVEWGMFGYDQLGTRHYTKDTGGKRLDVYIGSDDTYLYLLDGRTGEFIERFKASAPVWVSPAVGDIDGDGMQEVVFKDIGYFLWVVRDVSATGGISQPPYVPATGGQTLNVPGDYATIQGAIDAAQPGDTVLVAPGHYIESIDMKPEVNVIGSGPDVTTIQGDGSYLWGRYWYTYTVVGSGNATLSGFKITGSRYGVVNFASNPTISGNIISGNYYGVYNESANPTISSNVISGTYYSIMNYSYSNVIVANNIIKGGNQGIYNRGSAMSVANNVFTGINWNAIQNYFAEAQINNNIFAHNRRGIYNYNSSVNIGNNDFWLSGQNYDNRSTVRYRKNIEADPLFADPASGDYRLQAGSPCIEAGKNGAVELPAVDFDGNVRIFNGDGRRGPSVDMGAFEYGSIAALRGASIQADQASAAVSGTQDVSVTLTVANTGNVADRYYLWVDGIDWTWWSIDGSPVVLEAEGASQAVLTFSVPEGTGVSESQSVPVEVQVICGEIPQVCASAEIMLTIDP